MYNIRDLKQRERMILEADKDGDFCDVDLICDSIPSVIEYVKELEDRIRGYKGQTQKLQADIKDLERKLNNAKSQKFRLAKKRGH